MRTLPATAAHLAPLFELLWGPAGAPTNDDWLPPELWALGSTGVDSGCIALVLSAPEEPGCRPAVVTYYPHGGVEHVAPITRGLVPLTEEAADLLATPQAIGAAQDLAQTLPTPSGGYHRATLQSKLTLRVPATSWSRDALRYDPETALDRAEAAMRTEPGTALHLLQNAWYDRYDLGLHETDRLWDLLRDAYRRLGRPAYADAVPSP